jgi:hypothetical protein
LINHNLAVRVATMDASFVFKAYLGQLEALKGMCGRGLNRRDSHIDFQTQKVDSN